MGGRDKEGVLAKGYALKGKRKRGSGGEGERGREKVGEVLRVLGMSEREIEEEMVRLEEREEEEGERGRGRRW